MQACVTKKTEELNDGMTVWEARSERGVLYRLLNHEGRYAIRIRGVYGEIFHLPDIACTKERAIFLGKLFLEADVSPVNADEVIEELLAREPSLFL